MAKTNLHEPIFDICLNNISNIKDLHINRLLWSCLIVNLGHKPDCQVPIPSQWNHRDDVCSALLNRFAFESNYDIRVFLLRCIPIVFAPDQPINLLSASDEEIAEINLQDLRTLSSENLRLTACRWSKKLVKIWLYHVSCLVASSAAEAALNLRVIPEITINIHKT